MINERLCNSITSSSFESMHRLQFSMTGFKKANCTNSYQLIIQICAKDGNI